MNKHNKDLEVTEFSALELMTHDHLLGPDIYRASKHWEKLNDLNTQWLRVNIHLCAHIDCVESAPMV